MSENTNLHKFYILTREPSPVGSGSSATTKRNKISKGEVKSGTTPVRKYDATSDLVTEEQVENKQVKLSPGKTKTESLQGVVLRWTMTHTGIEHVIAESITLKELHFITNSTAGATAYNSIQINSKYTPYPEDMLDVISANIETSDFMSLIQKIEKTQLSHLFQNITKKTYDGTWAEQPIPVAASAWADIDGNLPPGVTIS